MKIRDKIYCKKSFNLGKEWKSPDSNTRWIPGPIDVFSEGKEYTIMDIVEFSDTQSFAFKGAYIPGNIKHYLYFYFSDDFKSTIEIRQFEGIKHLTHYPNFDDYFIHENRERRLKLKKLSEI